MRDAGERLGFREQPRRGARIVLRRAQQLQRDPSFQGRIVGGVHDAHAPLAEPLHEHVAIDRAADEERPVGHRIELLAVARHRRELATELGEEQSAVVTNVQVTVHDATELVARVAVFQHLRDEIWVEALHGGEACQHLFRGASLEPGLHLMGAAFPLAAAFLGGASAEDPATLATLETLLHEAWERAAGSWPELRVEPLIFVRHLAARVGEGGASSAALGQLAVADLYLCRAALDGNARALLAFDQLLAASEGALRRIGGDASFVDEVTQHVRAKLLVARYDARRTEPLLATYTGRGDLRGFLRVLLVRAALDHKRGLQRARAHVGQVAGEPAAAPGTNAVGAYQDPEVLHLRRTYGPAFEQAFADAVRALDPSQRTLLRYHYLDRLTIDQIGALEGIHRVSAARRLTRVREALVAETRRLLADRLMLGPTELRSVLRLLESDVDVSVRRLLGN